MEKYNQIILYVLLLWYLLSGIILFIMMGVDKSKAKHHKWRIPEFTLLFLGFIGGCVGGLLGMKVFRHKTKKVYFYGVYIISVLLHSYIFYLLL